MSQQERDSMNRLLNDTSRMFLSSKELLENYKKPDADTYQRKFGMIKKQFEVVMEEIQRGEKLEITNARKTHVVQEEQENLRQTEEFKSKMGLQVKILEESDYVDSIIQDRQKDIDNISKIMGDIKSIALDFNVEVEAQGSKLEDLDHNMGNVALNTKEATKQLNQANERSKKKRKMFNDYSFSNCLVLDNIVCNTFWN